MQVPLSWLKDYVDIDISPEELGEMLTMAGLELEALEYKAKCLDKVLVAQIKDISPHPNADRLSLCDVTDGANDYKIVCGATNMKSGDKVAFATIGANLPPSLKYPEGLEIKKTKIRGEVSEGMLCAEDELGLSEESEGIMILHDSFVLGSKLVDELDIEDVIFEIGITPNRPDCLSVLGIAREIAAILGKELKPPNFSLNESEGKISRLATVEIRDKVGCPRYSCRVIQDVKIVPSPTWLKTKLQAAEIRSINNVVDITNYVLLEFGQPLHAFDYDLLNDKKILVRLANDGEEIETLDSVKRTLTKEDLLICDAERPIALAGVMGGANSEVTQNTRNILLESAYFNPVRVRRTSKRTGLRSESSYRFERGVDPNGVTRALDRAAELIRDLGEGKLAKGNIDVYPQVIEPVEMQVSINKVNDILGTQIQFGEVIDILQSLDFEVLVSGEDKILVRVPTFRVDITREIDVIEEVGRLYGYNNVSLVAPTVEMFTDQTDPARLANSKLRDLFISNGFFEAVNYSFEYPELLHLFDDKRGLKLLNPLTVESSEMRTYLLAGLLKNIKLNLSRQVQEIRLFETGKVFYPKRKGQLPKEEKRFAAVATGRRQPEVWNSEEFDFFDLKSVLDRGMNVLSLGPKIRYEYEHDIKFLHPGKSSKIYLDGKDIGFIGELHPDYFEKFEIEKRVYVLEINLDEVVEKYSKIKFEFMPLSKVPSVRRDIALIVDQKVTAGEVLDQMKKVSDLVEKTWVFDVFQGKSVGEGKKSLGISMLLRSGRETLTDEEANKVQDIALNKLHSSLGAELRSI